MKRILLTFILLVASVSAMAEEEGGEHAKAPPVPSKGTPMIDVFKLPAVEEWQKKTPPYKGVRIAAWGESMNTIDGVECSQVAVGEIPSSGASHIWKRFCVPVGGGEILVESKPAKADEDIIYTPYTKWVESCKKLGSPLEECNLRAQDVIKTADAEAHK